MTWIFMVLLMGLSWHLLWSPGSLRFAQKTANFPENNLGETTALTGLDTATAMSASSEISADTQGHASNHNRAPDGTLFLTGQLRDTIHSIEVNESGLDDPTTNDYAIQLLRGLVEQSPADARNRCRLLWLLHATYQKEEFLQQAQELKQLCQPMDDEAWDQVCQMGRDLAPESSLFSVQSDSEEAIDEKAVDYSHPEYDRRGDVERRKWDRRTTLSVWLGTERRKWQRRRFFRRPSDLLHRS